MVSGLVAGARVSASVAASVGIVKTTLGRGLSAKRRLNYEAEVCCGLPVHRVTESWLFTWRDFTCTSNTYLRFRPTTPAAICCESSRLSGYQTALFPRLFLEALPVKDLRCKGGVTH